MRPKFFKTPNEFRRWLEKNHASKKELLVGFHKVGTGKPSLTWSESVDVALCYGWIDGIRRTIDAERYTIRFTARNPRSSWSAINLKKVEDLTIAGLMRPAGLAAFEARDATKPGYSIKSRSNTLPPEYERPFRANEKAWKYFASQTPSRQRTAFFWVASAKQEETRLRRLETLIADCAKDRPNWPLKRPTE
ncbi:MAG: YdeI/OmpD-associated family protein [Gemmatimonadaceae bacterium]